MFTSCSNKGFCITFANEYTLSVQWGPMNHCSKGYTNTNWDIAMSVKGGIWESRTAEIAVTGPDGMLIFMGSNTTQGNVHADGIVDLMTLVAKGNKDAIEVYFKTDN